MVREPNNMFIAYFSGHPVTVYPAGHTRWGQVVRELNNMFIVYFSDPVTVYPAGSTRWGHVHRWSGHVVAYSWCVGDVREVLQAHAAAHPDHQVTRVEMYISSDIGLSGIPRPPYRHLWGDPAELASWSEDAWTSLLQAVLTTWGSERLSIYVPFTAPLRGLLACLPHSHLTQVWYIEVDGGTAGLEEVEDSVYTCQQTGMMVWLVNTTILVPESEEDSLARSYMLCEAENIEGSRMVANPQWRPQTGEEYVWTDGRTWS